MKKIKFLIMLTLLPVILIGCAMPVPLDLLRVEIVHETDDRFLDDLSNDATNPPAGVRRVNNGEKIVLETSPREGVRVSSWIILDGFGNEMDEVSEVHELVIRMNHKIIANIECDSDEACIANYECINNACQPAQS